MSGTEDPFDLNRFVAAQDCGDVYVQAARAHREPVDRAESERRDTGGLVGAHVVEVGVGHVAQHERRPGVGALEPVGLVTSVGLRGRRILVDQSAEDRSLPDSGGVEVDDAR